jgi:FAD/FMN-containing dehydrogenase
MSNLKHILSVIKSEFKENRLTYQKNVPTFHPENAEEAAKLLKLANKHKQRIFITGFGNNIDPVGEPFESMLSIRTDRLNDLIELNAPDFYVKVGAGYPLRELDKDLKNANLFIPHSRLPYVGSVGGSIAVNLNAELHGHDLPLRRYFIWAEIVTPEGDVIKPGSVCFKSVSGYDIVKIFAGSWGLLGLIVTAAFRVLPVSAEGEYKSIKQKGIDRSSLLDSLNESNQTVDSLYNRKIKAKFDPAGVLPIV